MNNVRQDLGLLLDQASRSAFVEVKSNKPNFTITLDEEFSIFMNKTEEKLLRLIKDLRLSKEDVAMLLIDNNEMYRRVAQRYLEDINE